LAQFQLVRIEGLKELEANLKILREEFGVKTGGILIRGLRAGMKVIRDDARRRVPHIPSGYTPEFLSGRRGRGGKVRQRAATGANRAALLRSNIIEHAIPVKSRLAAGRPTVLLRVRNKGYFRLDGRIRFNNPGSTPGWWWWVEFGTSKQPARPFLRPAFEAQKIAALEAMKAHVRREIDLQFNKRVRRAA
jgi:HK97 gp10 family phage protein